MFSTNVSLLLATILATQTVVLAGERHYYSNTGGEIPEGQGTAWHGAAAQGIDPWSNWDQPMNPDYESHAVHQDFTENPLATEIYKDFTAPYQAPYNGGHQGQGYYGGQPQGGQNQQQQRGQYQQQGRQSQQQQQGYRGDQRGRPYRGEASSSRQRAQASKSTSNGPFSCMFGGCGKASRMVKD